MAEAMAQTKRAAPPRARHERFAGIRLWRPVAGVVVSHTDGALSDADARNLTVLREALGGRLLAEIPPLASDPLPSTGDPNWATKLYETLRAPPSP